MSLKVKLTSLITTFILLCSLLTVGVFAVKNTTFNVGGDIVFNVQGIEADIELTTNGVQNAEFNNDEVIGQDVLSKIQIRNNTSAESVASQFAKWSNLDMTFAEEQSTATIEFKITNQATEEDNYIDLSAIASATTKNNARISVANNAGGVTALIKTGESATFTITFSVIDDKYSASLEGFSVNFDMQKKVLEDFDTVEDLAEEYEFSGYSTSAPYTVAIAVAGASTAFENEKYTTTLSGDIVVPSYVNKDGTIYAVTTIAQRAFGHGGYPLSIDYTSITLPKTLTSFEGGTSFYSPNLTSIEIPYGVTSIAYSVFAYCSSLTSVTIPDSVTSIGNYAFGECTSLTNIIIPDSVISIGESVFNCCTSLTSIIIPDGVTSIEYGVFEGCTGLTSITIGSGVTSIGNDILYGCSGLASIVVDSENSVYDSRNNCNAIIETATNTLITGCQNTIIPNTVEAIGDSAFSFCRSLTSITIPNKVTSIGDSAFNGCTGLISVTIGSGVTTVAGNAFARCNFSELTFEKGGVSSADNILNGSNSATTETLIIQSGEFSLSLGGEAKEKLKKVILGDGVTYLGAAILSGCENLTSIEIGKGVTDIDSGPLFSGCENLTNITISEENVKYEDRDSNAIIEKSTKKLIAGCNSIIIPDDIISIGEYAFSSRESLTSITIPSSVTSIGEAAFAGCSNLTSIEIPSSVTSIGGQAFGGCESLTSITIPSSVTSIGYAAFNSCYDLTSITIPSSVTSIGRDAFGGCDNLKTINYTGTEEEWNALLANIGSTNDELTNATINYNYQG